MDDGRTLEIHIKDIPDNEFIAQVLQRLKTESLINIRLPVGSCTIDKCSANNPLLFISGWSGEKGMVHQAVFRNIQNLKDYDIYLSGSSAMVFNINQQLKDKKVPSSRIFSNMLDILRDKAE